jgi:addiction module HigA family antidote
MKKQYRGYPGSHPGRILYDQFLKPIGLSQNALARELGVPPRRINEIILGKRGISADTALRLAKRFRNPARFWMALQADFDLHLAQREARQS